MRDTGLVSRGTAGNELRFDHVDEDGRTEYVVDTETGAVYQREDDGLAPVDGLTELPRSLHREVNESYGVALSVPDTGTDEPYLD